MIALGVFIFILTIKNVYTETYDIEKFAQAKETIRSPVTVENKQETNRKVREAISSVEDQYSIDEEISEERLAYVDELFDALSKVDEESKDGRSAVDEDSENNEEESSKTLLTDRDKVLRLDELLSDDISNNISNSTFISLIHEYVRDESPELPEVSELEIMRHYTGLSDRNYGLDTGFYPLGSCTMKYNPKINEDVARIDGFTQIHPYQDPKTVQGALEMIYDMQTSLEEITGMHKFSMQPAAGAQGEWTALMMIRAFHEANGDHHKTEVIVPDSAHGTNPASVTVAGLDPVTVRSNDRGLVDIEHLKEVVSDNTAALMLTNPNTLGLFETDIVEMAEIVHGVGGRLYYDGANLNAIMGYARPGDMGFDAVHLNLHKTFTGPHGGGGPGSGPIGVTGELAPFLPKH